MMDDMRILMPVLIIVVVVATYFVAGKMAKARADRQLADVEKWPTLPTDERLTAHTRFTQRFIREEAEHYRNTLTFCVSVASAAFLMVVWMADINEQTREQASANCRNFRTLVALQAGDIDADIRAATDERNDLAAALSPQASTLTDIEGYEDLPFSAQTFLQGLLDAQILEAEVALSTLDSEIVGLRAREDVISGFAETLDCPE